MKKVLISNDEVLTKKLWCYVFIVIGDDFFLLDLETQMM